MMVYDELFMRIALDLAQQAWGMTAPNPMVGAVVVRDGDIVGRGYHHRAGEPHAEPNALDDAGEAARGSTLYVTLEPCSTQGRTPPCTERILRSGIARVVYASQDANPAHRGAAEGILRAAGIEVAHGILARECDRLNEDFFWYITRKRPFVTLKMAATLDGRIATASGASQWITGAKARSDVQKLRRRAGAILVGGTTVELDNPSLTVREPADWPRQPQRLVWTSRPLPPTCKLCTDGGNAPRTAKPVSTEEWLAFLARLGTEGVMNLLLEGGGELAAAALQARIVNKIVFYYAPKILCGRGSRPLVGGMDPSSLSEALEVEDVETELFAEWEHSATIKVTGYCKDVYRAD